MPLCENIECPVKNNLIFTIYFVHFSVSGCKLWLFTAGHQGNILTSLNMWLFVSSLTSQQNPMHTLYTKPYFPVKEENRPRCEKRLGFSGDYGLVAIFTWPRSLRWWRIEMMLGCHGNVVCEKKKKKQPLGIQIWCQCKSRSHMFTE